MKEERGYTNFELKPILRMLSLLRDSIRFNKSKVFARKNFCIELWGIKFGHV